MKSFDEKRVWLVIGHYGGKNTGDEAMLSGLLWGGKDFFRKIVFVTKDGDIPITLPPGVEVSAIRPAIQPLLSNLYQTYGVILGGGTHFHDDYRGLRYIRHLRYMLRIVGVSFVAKLLRKKVYWLSMGFGPFYRSLTRWVTKLGVWCCDGITVRDKASEQELITLIGKPKRYLLAFDLAALLLEINTLNSIKRQSNLVGISVTSIQKALSGGANAEKRFLECLQSSIIKLFKDKPFRLRIFIFRGGTRESDEALSYEIYRNLLLNGINVELLPYDTNPVNTLEKVAECEYFIAMRYHSAIFGYLAGCKLLLISYHRKVSDLAKEIMLHPHAVLNVHFENCEDEIFYRLNEFVSQGESYKALLPIDEAVKRARDNFSFFESP